LQTAIEQIIDPRRRRHQLHGAKLLRELIPTFLRIERLRREDDMLSAHQIGVLGDEFLELVAEILVLGADLLVDVALLDRDRSRVPVG
jgi:hypothetical protein